MRWFYSSLAGLLICGSAFAEDSLQSVYRNAECVSDGAGGYTTGLSPLIDAWLVDSPVRQTTASMMANVSLSERVEMANTSPNPNENLCASNLTGNAKSLCELRDNALALYMRPQNGDFRLERIDGQAIVPVHSLSDEQQAPADEEETPYISPVFRIFDLQPPLYHVRCLTYDPSTHVPMTRADTNEEGFFSDFRVARTLSGLRKSAIGDRDFATLSWVGDREAGTDVFNINLAIATGNIPWLSRLGATGPDDWSFRNRGFLTYERGTTSAANSNDVNVVTIGLSGAYNLHGEDDATRYDTSLEFITDDQLDSSAYRASISTRIPIGSPGDQNNADSNDSNLNSCGDSRRLGYGQYATLACFSDLRLVYRWEVNALTDWFHVSDAGGNTKLVNTSEFWRIGADLAAVIALREQGDTGAAWRLEAEYQLREGLTSDGGDAQFFTGSLRYLPSKASNFSVGLTYERGEHLITLADVEKWTFNFGFRY